MIELMLGLNQSLDPFSSLIFHPLFCDALYFGDHFLGDVLRRLIVTLEMHGRGGASLCRASEVGRVTEHLRERNEGRDDLRAARTRLHLLDLAATTVQVAVNCAHVLFGRDNL